MKGSLRTHRRENAPPNIVAHRGVSTRAPENTLAAFKLALDAGVDAVEMDVHLTADEHVAVIHDRTLQRTTTGNGAVRMCSIADLAAFDAGSWFDPAFSSERIPMLEEVLELVRGRCWANIELKSHSWHREPDGLLERRVLDAVVACGMRDQVLISSFDRRMLSQIRRIDATLPTGVLYNWHTDLFSTPTSLAAAVGASVFICGRTELRPSVLNDAKRSGIAVYVYTINDHAEASRLSALPVDGIISDAADTLLRTHPSSH